MHYDEQNHAPLTMAGITLRTNNNDKHCVNNIIALWDKLLQQNTLANISNKVGDGVLYGVYHNYVSDHNGDYNLTVGAEVDEITDTSAEIKYLIIPQAKYAVFTAPNREKLVDTWVDIWNTPIDRTFQFDFEKYHPNRNEVQIYIGIK